jgi:hypothetical protein
VSGFEQEAFIYESGELKCFPVNDLPDNDLPDNERGVISKNVARVGGRPSKTGPWKP